MKDKTPGFMKGVAGNPNGQCGEAAVIGRWLGVMARQAVEDMAEGNDLVCTLQSWHAALMKAGMTVEEAEALAAALSCYEENGRGAEKARNIGLLAGLLDRAAHCCFYSREIAESCGFIGKLAINAAAIEAEEGKGGEA